MIHLKVADSEPRPAPQPPPTPPPPLPPPVDCDDEEHQFYVSPMGKCFKLFWNGRQEEVDIDDVPHDGIRWVNGYGHYVQDHDGVSSDGGEWF